MQATDLVSHTHNNLMYVRTYMRNTISMVDRCTNLKLGDAEYGTCASSYCMYLIVIIHFSYITASISACDFNGGDTYVSMREDCGCGRGCNLACV